MNLNSIRQNPKSKYLFYFILLLPFILIPLLLSNSKLKNTSNGTTIPLIPSTAPKPAKKLSESIKSPFLPEDHKVFFNWNNVEYNEENSLEKYTINTPLINNSSIISVANKFGFVASDKSTETSEGSFLWINKESSLFASIPQNQITYFYTTEIPNHIKDISKEEAISSSKTILSSLFGETFVNTLNSDPSVKYFKLDAKKVEDEPSESTVKDSNVIQITFNQVVKNLSTVYQTRDGELISILIDTNKKLYRLDFHGGFDNISPSKTANLQNLEQLKESAKNQSLKITNSKDMGSERAYATAKNISVDVKSVGLGYFEFNKVLEPVFIIKGTMSAKGIPPYPATYIVPAEKTSSEF